MKNQLKFKAIAANGEVYLPNQLEILIKPGETLVYDLQGNELDVELKDYAGRPDSKGNDIFDGDKLTLEYEGDQGPVAEEVEVKFIRGSFHITTIGKGATHAVKLCLLPRDYKLTLSNHV